MGRGADKINCFPAGTLVATKEGLRPIEAIRPDDQLWAFDLVTSEWRLCQHRKPYSRLYKGMLVLTTIDGDTTEATWQHAYWAVRGEDLASRPWLADLAEIPKDATQVGRWVDSCDLRVGDEVLLRDGRIAPVERIEHRPFEGTVYNIGVEELNCYAVGRNSVLVHNACGDGTGAFEEVDEFRRLAPGLEPLGEGIPVKGDGLGTVSFIENGGKRFFGVNSSLLSDVSKDLGRKVFTMMQDQGYLKGATAYGNGAAQVLTHAEAHSLMRMWQKLGPNMPAEVTIFVDRYTCANCQKYLGQVAATLGVKSLNVVTKSGVTIPIAMP